MATSNFAITEGSGKNIATNSISEDAVTKQIQRVVPNTSAGVEIAPALEATLGDVKAAVQVMDDWDSGDTCKVTIQNKSQIGPAEPSIDSYANVAINLAAGANQVLVSSAANKQIWVYGYTIVANVAGTVSFQDEDDTAITGIMPIDAKGGIARNPSGNFSMPIWKLATDKDLEVDIVTSEIDGDLQYALVSV
jgi:hypothetical protein